MAASLVQSGRLSATDGSAVTTMESGNIIIAGDSNRALYVKVMTGATTGVEPTSVKWGGSGGTSLAKIASYAGPSTNCWSSIWRLAAPNATTSTIYLTWPSGQDEKMVFWEVYKDVDQTTPEATITSAAAVQTGSTAVSTSATNTASGQLVIDLLTIMQGAADPKVVAQGPNQTEIASFENGEVVGYEAAASSYQTAPGTTTNMQWTITGFGNPIDWVHLVFPINAAAAASLSATHFRARNDDGSESTATWYAAEDTNFSAPSEVNTRIRYQINTSGDSGAKTYQLEYKQTSASSWSVVGNHITSATLSYGADGGVAYSTVGGTSVTPSYPSSITTKSALILVVGQKPSSANLGTVTTPAGWTLVTSALSAGGYGTSLAADTGNSNIFVFKKDTVTGTESGTLSVTVGTNDVCWADIIRVESNYACTYTYSGVVSGDITAGNVSVGFLSDPGIQVGDFIIAGMCIPTDVTTPTQFSSQSASCAGVTFGPFTEITEPDSNVGNDIGGFLFYTSAAGGTGSSGNPTIIATAGGTTTNVRGPAFFLRIRATATQYPFELAPSSNIAAGGVSATTRQLTIPSGKASGDFTAGYISDDTNPLASLDLAADKFTEVEWCIKTLSAYGAGIGAAYNLRVTNAGSSLDSNMVSAIWTIAAAGTSITATVPVVSAAYSLRSPTVIIEPYIIANALSGSYNLKDGSLVVGGSVTATASPLSGNFYIYDQLISYDNTLIALPLSAQYFQTSPQLSVENVAVVAPLSATYSIISASFVVNYTYSASILSGNFTLPSVSVSNGTSITATVSYLSATNSLTFPTMSMGSAFVASYLSATNSLTSPALSYDFINTVGVISGSYSLRSPSMLTEAILQVAYLSGSYSNNQLTGWDNTFIPDPVLSTFDITSAIVSAGSGISLTVGVLSAAFSVQSVSVGYGLTVSANYLSASYSVGSTISTSNSIEVSALSASYSTQSPSLLYDYAFNVSRLSASYTLENAIINVGGSTTVQVGIISASYTIQSPQIFYDYAFNVSRLSALYSTNSPTLTLGIGSIVTPSILSAAYSLGSQSLSLGSTVSVGVLSGAYQVSNVSLVVGTGNIIAVPVVSGAYSLTSVTVLTTGSVSVSVGALVASYDLQSVSIAAGGNITISVSYLGGFYNLGSSLLRYDYVVSVGAFTETFALSAPVLSLGSAVVVAPLSGIYSINNAAVSFTTNIVIVIPVLSAFGTMASPSLGYDNSFTVSVISGSYSTGNAQFSSGNIIFAASILSATYSLTREGLISAVNSLVISTDPISAVTKSSDIFDLRSYLNIVKSRVKFSDSSEDSPNDPFATW